MTIRSLIIAAALAIAAPAAAAPPAATPLRIAAASDLGIAFKEVGEAFERASGDRVVFIFGSTGLLEKQIAEGAPFDLFAAANVSYADDAVRAGACAADSKAEYARGQIVMWWLAGSTLRPPATVAELADARFVRIAIANPAHAPYGKAAVEALTKAGVFERVKPRLVYGENIQQAFQFAQSGNAEVAIVAMSLAVAAPDGAWVPVPYGDYAPIHQAMVVCGSDGERVKRARAFAAFVNSTPGRAIMRRYGFLLPGESRTASAK